MTIKQQLGLPLEEDVVIRSVRLEAILCHDDRRGTWIIVLWTYKDLHGDTYCEIAAI